MSKQANSRATLNARLLSLIQAPGVVAAATLAGALALVWGIVPLGSWEVWWHLLMGRIIAQFNAVPAANHLSYAVAPEAPSLVIPWLGQLALFKVYSWLDVEALLWLRNHLIAIAFALATLAASLRAKRAGLWVGALSVLGVIACAPRLVMEPQLMALPLLGAGLMWASVAQRVKARWAHVLMGGVSVGAAALWANLDVSFGLSALVAMATALNLLKQEDKRLIGVWVAVSVGCLGAALLNPRGPELLVHALKVLALYPGHEASLGWGRLWPFASVEGALFGAALILSLGLWAKTRALKAGDALLLIFTAVMAMTHARASIWFGLALPFCLSPALEALMARREPKPLKLRTAALALGLSLSLPILTQPIFQTHAPLASATSGLFGARGAQPHATTVKAALPIEAVQMIKQQAPAPIIYADKLAAGYAAFELSPDRPKPIIFADYRLELLDTQRWALYPLIEQTDTWRGLFQQWGVNVLLLHKARQASLVARVSQEPEWLRSYDEGEWVYFVHFKR